MRIRIQISVRHDEKIYNMITRNTILKNSLQNLSGIYKHILKTWFHLEIRFPLLFLLAAGCLSLDRTLSKGCGSTK